MTFDITPPTNIPNLFGNWLRGVDKENQAQIRVGACGIVWTIWRVRNDFVFNRSKALYFMQVMPLATH